MSNSKKLRDQVVVVDLGFTIWSGQRKLDNADIRLGDGGELPPEKVANLGNKKIIDRTSLNPFHRIKTQARRYLDSIGMPFLGGWACPVAYYDDIKSRLDGFQAEFESSKRQFLSNYDAVVANWIADNPDYAQEIRAGVMDVRDVEERIDFSFETFKLQPAAEDEEGKIERKISRLGEDLLDEVAAAASKFADTLVGRTSIAASTAITLRGIRDKVEGMAFLNGNLAPVADLLTETIKGYQMHKDGRNIVAPFLYQVQAVALTLGSRERMEQFARGEISIGDEAKAVEQGVNADFYASMPEQQPEVEVEAVEAEAEVEVPAQAEAKPVSAGLFDDLDDLFPVVEGEVVFTEPAAAPAPVEFDVGIEVSDNFNF